MCLYKNNLFHIHKISSDFNDIIKNKIDFIFILDTNVFRKKYYLLTIIKNTYEKNYYPNHSDK